MPLLIRLALGDDEQAWLYTVASRLLRTPRPEAFDLASLIRGLLLAWNRGMPSRTRVSETVPAARWAEPLNVPIRRPA